jgi:L-lactate dehydrogenase complex protein LldG
MTDTTRNQILNKLRNARRAFEDAPPRPKIYLPVSPPVDDELHFKEALLERFRHELELLRAESFVVDGDAAARELILGLLEEHQVHRIAAWHFAHIPVDHLYTAIEQAGYIVHYPRVHESEFRAAMLDRLETATVGLTGVDAAAATTGTLIVSTGEGKSRIATILPPVHIAVLTIDQLLPRVEDWLKQERHAPAAIQHSANICFISGPSRTADIEKQLVLGVHGPGRLQVVIKR